MSLANKVVTSCDPHLHTIKQGLGKAVLTGFVEKCNSGLTAAFHFPFALFVWVVWLREGDV